MDVFSYCIQFSVTTIRPNLGTIVYPDFRKISLADLPGLIEGAHINIGNFFLLIYILIKCILYFVY